MFLNKIVFIFLIIFAINKPLYWRSRRLVKEIGSRLVISIFLDRLMTASQCVYVYNVIIMFIHTVHLQNVTNH